MNEGTRRGLRILRDVYVTVILLAAVYFGLTGADDILNTTTPGERTVGVTSTLYGVAATITLYAYWRRVAWLGTIALIWAILVTITATLATIVYDGGLVGGVAAFLATVLITATVYLPCRSRLKDI